MHLRFPPFKKSLIRQNLYFSTSRSEIDMARNIGFYENIVMQFIFKHG